MYVYTHKLKQWQSRYTAHAHDKEGEAQEISCLDYYLQWMRIEMSQKVNETAKLQGKKYIEDNGNDIFGNGII